MFSMLVGIRPRLIQLYYVTYNKYIDVMFFRFFLIKLEIEVKRRSTLPHANKSIRAFKG